jgi:hypothetical protein
LTPPDPVAPPEAVALPPLPDPAEPVDPPVALPLLPVTPPEATTPA